MTKITKCLMCGSEVESEAPVVICTGCSGAKAEPVDTNSIYKNYVFPSGQYEGELISDVAVEDQQYCEWVAEESQFGHDIKEACKYHLGWL